MPTPPNDPPNDPPGPGPAAPAAPAPAPAPGNRTALARAVAVVGDRWTLLVLDALLDAPARFGDLQRAVGAIAPNILTQRLRTLEQHGLVRARPYSERPVRVTYEATAAARDLAPALHLLADWGARHGGLLPPTAGDPVAPPGVDDDGRHACAACGTRVEYRPWCPTCDRSIEPDGASDLRWA